MAREYPFPIPEATSKEVLADIAKSGPPWGDLDAWKEASGKLTSFSYFNKWHYYAGNLIENLQHTFTDVRPADYEAPYEREKWMS